MEFIPLLILSLLMWMLLIRPQQQRVRRHQAVVASLQVGDEVVTAGGFYGRITRLDDESAWLELAPGVVARVMRGSIGQRLTGQEEGADGAAGTGSTEREQT